MFGFTADYDAEFRRTYGQGPSYLGAWASAAVEYIYQSVRDVMSVCDMSNAAANMSEFMYNASYAECYEPTRGRVRCASAPLPSKPRKRPERLMVITWRLLLFMHKRNASNYTLRNAQTLFFCSSTSSCYRTSSSYAGQRLLISVYDAISLRIKTAFLSTMAGDIAFNGVGQNMQMAGLVTQVSGGWGRSSGLDRARES